MAARTVTAQQWVRRMTSLCKSQIQRHYDSWKSGSTYHDYAEAIREDIKNLRKYTKDWIVSNPDPGIDHMRSLAQDILKTWDSERKFDNRLLDKRKLNDLRPLLVIRQYKK
jgi:hypothetical protein